MLTQHLAGEREQIARELADDGLGEALVNVEDVLNDIVLRA